MEKRMSTTGYVVYDVTYKTMDDVAEAFDVSRNQLLHAYNKFRDMQFAVEYVKKYHKNVNRAHNRVYKVRGKEFKRVTEVARFLGISESTFKELAKGCKTLDEVADKADEIRKNSGYEVDGVVYGSIRAIEEAYDIPNKRLFAAHRKFQDMDKAFHHVLNHDYLNSLTNARRIYSKMSFKSKSLYNVFKIANSTNNMYRALPLKHQFKRSGRKYGL